MNSHNIKHWCMLAAVTLITACGSEQEQAEEQEVITTEFQSIPLSTSDPQTKLADLIESIEIVKLEETDESLLSFVNNIQVTNNGFAFANDGGIYTFSNSGDYIQKFDRSGEGPEEYDNIEDLWVEGDTVVIHDTKSYIKKYLLDGTFVSAERLENNSDHLLPFEDGYLMDMGYRPVNDSLKFGLIKTNKAGEFEEGYLPFEKFPGFSIKTSVPTLQVVDGLVLLQKMLTDSVYLYADGDLKPFLHFDFGDDWLRNEIELSGNFFQDVQKAEKVWLASGYIGSKLTMISAQVGMGASERYLIDRANGKTVRVDSQMDPEEKYYYTLCKWLSPNEAILSIQSLQVASLMDELEETQYSFREGSSLEQIESSENPVLLFVKWKDSAEW